MEDSWKGSISVREAEQELLGASFGNRNRKAYLREFGEEYTGQMDGEIGWQLAQEYEKKGT